MAKKKEKFDKKHGLDPAKDSKRIGISVRGWKTIGIGTAIVAAGFFVLSLTDPWGQNWASKLSPFLILGGYAVIGVGIVLPEKKQVQA